jgi:hypothetical protein
MDLIVNTWTTNDPAPLSMVLITASIITAVVGVIAFMNIYDKARRRRKIAGITIAIATVAALAIMIPTGSSLPRVDTPNAASYIEATGTVDTITPNLNRGGTGIRLTDHPEILLAIDEAEADNFAGLEGHPTTLYCNTPDAVDRDDPALAAGTILDCSSTPTPYRNSNLDNLLPPPPPPPPQTTTAPITLTGEQNQ